MLAFLLTICLALGAWGQEPGNFQRVALTDLNPDAVCNDGSPATYFFRPGSGSGAGIWTIYLEGGGFCQDIPSCQSRWQYTKHFMTSTLLPEILNDTTLSPDVNHWGINSGNATANPHFYNANQVYLWYCSSDVHAGDIEASNATGGFHFRGKVIVQTLVEHLLTKQTPSMTEAKFILLTGFSAGGMGVLNNADFVGAMVSKAVPAATYKAYADSGWLLDVPTYGLTWTSRQQLQSLYTNFNAQFDDSCVAALEPVGQAWRCQFGDIVHSFITTPLFIAQYQFDMPFMNDVAPPFNTSTWEYASVLRRDMLMQTSTLPSQFSPNCYCHGVESYDTRWNVIQVNGTTASDAVYNFFINGENSRNVDTCDTFICNPTCVCVWPKE
eukprot:Phypoly_transcript_04900.p1 GENE.Phypoly_transcript_04900~~Phypoly_transcript_04900.p1  ORF type:complete len:383 (+),score=41.65 Phypoly_transcript_04900:775-1923(+)